MWYNLAYDDSNGQEQNVWDIEEKVFRLTETDSKHIPSFAKMKLLVNVNMY